MYGFWCVRRYELNTEAGFLIERRGVMSLTAVGKDQLQVRANEYDYVNGWFDLIVYGLGFGDGEYRKAVPQRLGSHAAADRRVLPSVPAQ